MGTQNLLWVLFGASPIYKYCLGKAWAYLHIVTQLSAVNLSCVSTVRPRCCCHPHTRNPKDTVTWHSMDSCKTQAMPRRLDLLRSLTLFYWTLILVCKGTSVVNLQDPHFASLPRTMQKAKSTSSTSMLFNTYKDNRTADVVSHLIETMFWAF